MNLLENLKLVPAIAEVPEKQLQWLAGKGSTRNFKDGEYIFQKGDDIHSMMLLIKGYMTLHITQAGSYRQIGEVDLYGITGALPFSRARQATGNGVAHGDTTLFLLDRQYFKEMVAHHFELTEALVHTMTSRVREFTTTQQLNEKLLSLGKLSAGLAHELNNPASAVSRSASELQNHLKSVPEKIKRIMSIRLEPQSIDHIIEIIADVKPVNIGLQEQTDKEDELIDFLEEQGIDDPYQIAETLVEYGMDTETLHKIFNLTGEQNFFGVIEWIDNTLTTEKLVNEIRASSGRIASLVGSIKNYSYMDRSPEKTNADLHDGLDSTLVMLGHKLKKKHITIEKNYNKALPEVPVYAGELNQVWTNIIDNAIDAMENDGKLVIETKKMDNNTVKINVTDNGPGIPDEIIHSIFDPFFTTKSVGKGTGMGLDISMKIIKKHNGEIKVKSEAGVTTFSVILPSSYHQ